MILYEIAYWVGIVGVLAGAGGVVVAIWLILRGPQRDNGQEEEGRVTVGESP